MVHDLARFVDEFTASRKRALGKLSVRDLLPAPPVERAEPSIRNIRVRAGPPTLIPQRSPPSSPAPVARLGLLAGRDMFGPVNLVGLLPPLRR